MALSFTVGILLLAGNGFLNILFSARDQEIFYEKRQPLTAIEKFESYFLAAPKVIIPEIGELPVEGAYSGFTILKNGVRLSSPGPSEPLNKIAVFGASQAFGYGLPDEQTLVSALNQISEGDEFVNYAVIGQSLTASMRYIRFLLREKDDINQVVLLGNPMLDIFNFCRAMRGKASPNVFSTLAVKRLVDRLKAKFGDAAATSSFKTANNCADSSYPETVLLPEILLNLGNTQQFLADRNIDFQMFLLPSPYDASPDVSNLQNIDQSLSSPLAQEIYPKIYTNLISWPGLQDLSRAFDGEKPLFTDHTGHISYEGNQILARHIVEALKTTSASSKGSITP